jgi:hypothetical protein
VTVSGGPESIVVTRRTGKQGDWLCYIWLAERSPPMPEPTSGHGP